MKEVYRTTDASGSVVKATVYIEFVELIEMIKGDIAPDGLIVTRYEREADGFYIDLERQSHSANPVAGDGA